MMFAIVKTLLLPPTSLLLIALVGLAMPQRLRHAGRLTALLAVIALTALSIPLISESLVDALHPPRPFQSADARDAGAVVILGGGVRRRAPEYDGRDTLNVLTLERVRYGARVAKATGLPVLVSGGAPQGGEAEAEVMGRALREEFGVPVRWMESRSRNTQENAANSAALLHRAGIGTVVLVAHAFDMQRARAEFAMHGIRVVPAATNLSAKGEIEVGDFVPSIAGLLRSYYAAYELAALARLRLRVPARDEPGAHATSTAGM